MPLERIEIKLTLIGLWLKQRRQRWLRLRQRLQRLCGIFALRFGHRPNWLLVAVSKCTVIRPDCLRSLRCRARQFRHRNHHRRRRFLWRFVYQLVWPLTGQLLCLLKSQIALKWVKHWGLNAYRVRANRHTHKHTHTDGQNCSEATLSIVLSVCLSAVPLASCSQVGSRLLILESQLRVVAIKKRNVCCIFQLQWQCAHVKLKCCIKKFTEKARNKKKKKIKKERTAKKRFNLIREDFLATKTECESSFS